MYTVHNEKINILKCRFTSCSSDLLFLYYNIALRFSHVPWLSLNYNKVSFKALCYLTQVKIWFSTWLSLFKHLGSHWTGRRLRDSYACPACTGLNNTVFLFNDEWLLVDGNTSEVVRTDKKVCPNNNRILNFFFYH